jgi:hypothetical protein
MDVLDFKQYTKQEIYKCFLETVAKLGLDNHTVLSALDDENYKQFKRSITEYIMSINLPSRNLKILSGPELFIFYRDILGKRILMLGETHHIDSICSTSLLKTQGSFEIQDWLVQIGLNAPTCIDIFTETGYKQSLNLYECPTTSSAPLSKFEAPLIAVECIFNDLIENNKMPSYVRYHNIDVRKYNNNLFPIAFWTTQYHNHTNLNKLLKFQNVNIKYHSKKKQILSYALTLDLSTEATNYYNNYMRDMFDIISEDYTEHSYQKVFDNYVVLINKQFPKTQGINKNKMLQTLLDIYYDMVSIYDGLMLIPTDLYFLTRLFVRFDEKKIIRGPEGCRMKENATSNNVIVYGGREHIRVYNTFIQIYFNSSPTFIVDNGDKGSQCIKFETSFDFYTY